MNCNNCNYTGHIIVNTEILLTSSLKRTMASTAKAINEVLTDFYAKYKSKTPQKLKLVDAYLAYIMITGIILFAYCCIVGTFPFNSFLAGFISCVGSFVLAGKSCTFINGAH